MITVVLGEAVILGDEVEEAELVALDTLVFIVVLAAVVVQSATVVQVSEPALPPISVQAWQSDVQTLDAVVTGLGTDVVGSVV